MSTTRVYRALAIAVGFALVASLCSCAITSSDLSGSLVGRVLVVGTGAPISGAVVECEGSISVSAADGSYNIAGISTGDRVVSASAPGYDDYSQVVSVGETTLHDVYMEVYVGPARLYGYVAHSVLGPLEGATVSIGDLNVVTDSLGFYEYPGLQQTTYFMMVTKDGYRMHAQSVRPTSEDYRFDVGLLKMEQTTLWSVADATVLENSPGANFGDEQDLYLYNNQATHERFYIFFDLGEIEPTAEPSVATLRLYDIWDLSGEDPREVLAAGLLWPWDELSVTWTNGPQTTGESSVNSTYVDRWYDVDLTDYFRDWLVDGIDNNGLLLDSPIDYTTPRFIFASREYVEEDKRPYVVLEYAW